tara:strand:+ start:367 stop:588 length:222 start_codon:yes stop_codon:yes gene_type:complete
MSKFSAPKAPSMPVIVATPPPVKKPVEPKVVEAKEETRKKKKGTKTRLTSPRGVTRQANVLRQTLGGTGDNLG